MKKIELRDGELTVVVEELTVRQVLDSVDKIKTLINTDDPAGDITDADNLNKLAEFANLVVTMPEGTDFLDLKFSEIQELISPVMEVNASFFGQMSALGLIPDFGAPAEEAPSEEENETETPTKT